MVCYDVRSPDRLRRTHQVMLGYGDPLQYSVFLCELSATERLLMERALRGVVSLKDDSVIIIDLGPARGLAQSRIIELGVGRIPVSERSIVV